MTEEVSRELIPNVVERLKFLAARQNHFKESVKGRIDEEVDGGTIQQNDNNENSTPEENFQLERQPRFIGKKSFTIASVSIRCILLDDVGGARIVNSYDGKRVLEAFERRVVTDSVVRYAMKSNSRYS